MKNIELERIDNNISGEPPPEVWVKIIGRCDNPVECLENIKGVQRIISSVRTRDWPDDEWWKDSLPRWFVETFNKPIDEIIANKDLWDFGSWIDAIKNPGWEWWSSRLLDDRWEINLQAIEDPFSIGPLVYIARTAGSTQIEITEPSPHRAR
ncbi:hypothetical protein [Methylomagnum ishizawai]|uniref:hypothetical protein n=1 Tax=Methylomagnum ishizawai TaxID=1760988 RepID=UPI000F74BD93|nr:hypothetical protein [Methylomagnum ishizawai]